MTDVPAYPAFDCEVIEHPQTEQGLHITGKTGVLAQTVIAGRTIESMVLVDNDMVRRTGIHPVDLAQPVLEDEFGKYIARHRGASK